MEKRRISSKFLYITSVIFFFAALIIGELNAYFTKIGAFSDILLRLMFVWILIGGILTLRERAYPYPWIYFLFFFIMTVFWNLSYYKCVLALNCSEKLNAEFGVCGFTLSSVLWFINCLRSKKGDFKRFFSSLKRYIPLVVICGIYFCAFLLNLNTWFLVDSWAYYSSIVDHVGTWRFSFTDMSSLTVGGHASYAYSVLLMIGEFLVPNLGHGQRLINCLLSIVTIIAFYFVTEKIWGVNKRIRSIFLTVIFAFAPLFYGISHLMSTDFPLLCFFTMLVAATFYRITFLKFIMIMSVCFSKETGVLLLVGLYLGEVMADYVKGKKKGFNTFFWNLFELKKLLVYSPAFLYVQLIPFESAGWIKNLRNMFSPASTESIATIPSHTYTWWHYPIFKIFEYFFMNFYWLIWILLLAAVVLMFSGCRGKRKGLKSVLIESLSVHLDYYIPIFSAYLFFCVLGIAYFTYIHYRYVQLGHLFYVLCLGIIIDVIPGESLKKEFLLIPFTVLMSIESFITIDPVTYLFFKDFNAGNGNLVSTRQYWYIALNGEIEGGYFWEAEESIMAQHYLADGTEYNREMVGLQRVMENMLSTINYTPDKLIVLDMFGGWQSYTCMQLFGVEDCNGWYWDSSINTVVRYETDKPLNFAFDHDNLAECMNNFSQVYYIDFPFNKYHQNSVLSDYQAMDSFSVSHFRWKIDIYRLK